MKKDTSKRLKKIHGCKSCFATGMRKHKNIFNSFCTFYKSGLKAALFLLFTNLYIPIQISINSYKIKVYKYKN